MYECNNRGMRGASHRITAVRNPDNFGFHETLRDNQYANVSLDRFHVWLDWFKRGLHLRTMSVTIEDELNNWTDAAHPKKKLRVQARTAIVADGRTLGIRCRKVRYKCKPGELLADGKTLRGIGDIGTPGSTVLGFYMPYVKSQFAQPFYHTCGGVCQFIEKPHVDILRSVFDALINVDNIYYPFFSDDACISIRCSDGVFMANLDISKCDGSNYKPVFDLLKEAMSVSGIFQTYIDDCFLQLEQPCIISSVDRKYKVRLTPLQGPVLYSGSVLTTSVNNMANTIIFHSIVEALNGPRLVGEMPQLIEAAAARVGYILKVQVCAFPEEIQFLKHSPCIHDGVITPILNLGCWMRGFGTIVGDLPGRGSLLKRAKVFNSEVVRSRVYAGNHPLSRAFQKFVVKDRSTKLYTPDSFTNTVGDVPNDFWIPSYVLARRYHVTPEAIDELCDMIGESDVGDIIYHPVIDIILKIDYGY